MEKLIFDYSLKNIPKPENTTYNLKLIEITESVLKRKRWKAYFFLNPDKKQEQINFSSCYFPYINDIIALFLLLSTLVKIHSHFNIHTHTQQQLFRSLSDHQRSSDQMKIYIKVCCKNKYNLKSFEVLVA